MQYIEYIVQIPDGMVDRLNKIGSQFDEIAKDCEALQLKESDGVRHPNNKTLGPPMSHLVDEASIFGRETEITEVMDFLLSEKRKIIKSHFWLFQLLTKVVSEKSPLPNLSTKMGGFPDALICLGGYEEFNVGKLTVVFVDKLNSSFEK